MFTCDQGLHLKTTQRRVKDCKLNFKTSTSVALTGFINNFQQLCVVAVGDDDFFVEGFEEILARLKFNINYRLCRAQDACRVSSQGWLLAFVGEYLRLLCCVPRMVMTYDSKYRVDSAASLCALTRAVDKSIKKVSTSIKERLAAVCLRFADYVTELLLSSLTLYGS
jgi:hypothetical protein